MNISKHILIIGGYGRAGTEIAQLLVKHTNHSVTLAGRSVVKAKKVSRAINKKFNSKQVYGIEIDISDVGQLQKTIQLYDTLISCVPYPNNKYSVVKVIVNSQIHYLDLSPDNEKFQMFENFHLRIKDEGRVCLLDSGWEPGLPSLLVNLACKKIKGHAKDVTIHAAYRDKNMPFNSIKDIIEHAKFKQVYYESNEWKKTSMLDNIEINFPEPFGKTTGFITELEELKTLPENLNIESLKLYQGGYNLVSDAILFLLLISGLRNSKFFLEQGVKFFQWANKKFTKPASAGIIKVIVSNLDETISIYASYKDLYRATAIPVVASILLLEKEEILPGVGYMGHKLPPIETISLLSKMGISITANY